MVKAPSAHPGTRGFPLQWCIRVAHTYAAPPLVTKDGHTEQETKYASGLGIFSTAAGGTSRKETLACWGGEGLAEGERLKIDMGRVGLQGAAESGKTEQACKRRPRMGPFVGSCRNGGYYWVPSCHSGRRLAGPVGASMSWPICGMLKVAGCLSDACHQSTEYPCVDHGQCGLHSLLFLITWLTGTGGCCWYCTGNQILFLGQAGWGCGTRAHQPVLCGLASPVPMVL